MNYDIGFSNDSNDENLDENMCQVMSDSASDDSANDEINHDNGSNDRSFGFSNQDKINHDDRSFGFSNQDKINHYDRSAFKQNSYCGQLDSDGPADCYSPSQELRRQSIESRASYEEYSSRRDDPPSKSSNSGSSYLNYFRPSNSGEHSTDDYSSEIRNSKTERKSKSHENKKRKYDESFSGSSGSQEFLSPQQKKSTSNYSLPSGTSLNKPLKGGIGAVLMSKMGYEPGKGLGKFGEGRVDPVELSRQKGRQGLGLTIPNLDTACDHYDPSLEVIEVRESIDWLICSDDEIPGIDELNSWMEEGPRNLNISEMSDFCDPQLLSAVLSCKSVFDTMDNMDMIKARSRSNPFEAIRKSIFQNRAAVKMANMDAIFDFMFTNPTYPDGEPMVGDNSLLYFADVCAGPGGFSEYVLWRKKWKAKGIGFTLRGENDFKLEDFKSGHPESFKPYYGSKKDGNVFDSDNIEDLTQVVMNATDNRGVHFMMADGGFSVEGQENIQELLSKQLYLCQFLVALCIVRDEGHFVCKLFDLFSPFSVGLVYLMYRCFNQISIFKPNTSRPANSERYIICKWKRRDTSDVRDYMFRINQRLNELGSDSSEDVNICVPVDILQNDSNFYDYIITSNNKLGERQIVNLAKISAYYRDSALFEPQQSLLRKQCLAAWELPDKISRTESLSVEDVLKKLLNDRDKTLLHNKLANLKRTDIERCINEHIYDWKFVVLGNQDDELTYFLGLGRKRVMKYQFSKYKWDLVANSTFELSPGTLVLGEVVIELSDDRKSKKNKVLHIIDALSLGHEIIKDLEFSERLKMCRLYTEALNSNEFPNSRSLRVVSPFDFCHLNRLFLSLFPKDDHLAFRSEDGWIIPAKGVSFFSSTKEPWKRHLSKKTDLFYFFNIKTKDSFFEDQRPPESIGSFRNCIEKTLVWWWKEGVGLRDEDRKDDVVHKNDLLNHIKKMSK